MSDKGLRQIKRNLEAKLGIAPFVSLKPIGKIRGYVLLSYITAPFRLRTGESLPTIHSSFWEVRQIAKTFLDLGYGVDVIDWDNRTFQPKRHYSFCVDIHNLERLAQLLNSDCITVLHITGAHWLFQNSAEYSRLLALQKRRGITLLPRRLAPASFGIEYADYATTWGNEFTVGTFNYAGKDIHRLPVPATAQYPWPDDKEYYAHRNHFLWFGNTGLVHKGLDLMLEAFVQLPDCHLTVCGPIGKEEDFETAYYKELYQTPNIETLGWVDTDSKLFQEITKKCVAVIHPSCSEGCSGSVVTCLHAGLIPIVSYESGIDVGDFGLLLEDCSVEGIIAMVKRVSAFPDEELRSRSRKAWEHAKAFYTRENYATTYQNFVTQVLGVRNKD